MQSLVETMKFYRRGEVSADAMKDRIYVFGDNTKDRTVTHYVPSSTQACIRGLPNAFGIDTKKDRGTSNVSYFSDVDIGIYQRYIDKVVAKLKGLQGEGKVLVFPEDGIGTGKAMLKEKAPLLFEYLRSKLYTEFGFANGAA